MKKVLFIAIALFGIIPFSIKASAQTKIQTNKLQSPFTDKLELRSSIRTDFHPEKQFSVEVMIKNNTEKGNIVQFSASGPVEKVVVSAFDKMNESITTSTTSYNAGTTKGIFYLDAPSYERRKFYILTFFVKGLPEQVWSTMVERKQPTTINKLPHKLPNL